VPVNDAVDPAPEATKMPFRIVGQKMIDLPALQLWKKRLPDEGVQVPVQASSDTFPYSSGESIWARLVANVLTCFRGRAVSQIQND
jgi:hypothetical protein